ncbi:MAG: hypothetical protein JWR02_1046 [Mucilaginibacter sp.]|nr:hypothetical protein [Mucilaginibacter sp.]
MKNAGLNKKWLLILTFPILVSFLSMDIWKQLDLGSFKISIPKGWNYKKAQGEDSFIGKIVGPKVSLFFDCSTSGYASHLIPTEREYLNQREWNTGYFYKPGVTYTADFNVKNERAAQMKKLGTTDSTLVHVEADPSYQTKTNIHFPTSAQKAKFPKADYIADLTFRDSTIYVPISIPPVIKSHNIQIDATEKYIIKIVSPKIAGNGMTGIYIHSRSSSFNFQMNGKNLSAKDQESALKAFKTIKFKE